MTIQYFRAGYSEPVYPPKRIMHKPITKPLNVSKKKQGR